MARAPNDSKPLLLSRRFAPLFWCQFFSAFSDNFLKNALVFLILYKIGGGAAESLITLAAAVFIAGAVGRAACPLFSLLRFRNSDSRCRTGGVQGAPEIRGA